MVLQGMCQAAGYIYKKLMNDGILSQAFSIAPVSTETFTGFAVIQSLYEYQYQPTIP